MLAAATLLAIMLLTCVDVAGRYVFNAPVPGAFELTEFAMGALIFTGLPLTTLREQHVTVDLMDGLVPRVLRPARDAAVHAVSAVCMAVIAWRLWVKAGQMAAAGDTTAALHIGIAPLVYYMSLQSAVTAGVLLLLVARREGAAGWRAR